MATTQEISAAVDAIVAAFGGDVQKFGAFLTRAALETELAEIESDVRNLQATADESASDLVSQVDALLAAKAAKQAEIDALD